MGVYLKFYQRGCSHQPYSDQDRNRVKTLVELFNAFSTAEERRRLVTKPSRMSGKAVEAIDEEDKEPSSLYGTWKISLLHGSLCCFQGGWSRSA